MTRSEPRLSVVVPAYEAAAFIVPHLEKLVGFLERLDLEFEVIVVDDGSEDGTGDRIEAAGLPRLRVLRHAQNRGKFGALKTGMAAARGRTRIFTDADLPYELEALPYLESLVGGRGFHVAVGDRTLEGSVYGERLPFLRRIATQVFTACVRLFVTGGLHDTQCGLKAFRGDVAAALFPLLREEGFSGDVELLYIALKYNLEIRRIPVRLQHQGPSTVSAGRDGLAMLRSLLRLRGRWRSGQYQDARLARIARQDYWEETRHVHSPGGPIG